MSKIIAIAVIGGLVTIFAAAHTPDQSSGGTNPLDNAQGMLPGLAPIAKKDLPRARVLIRRVRIAAARSTRPYDRAAFGRPWTDSSAAAWSHNQCDTRDDVLRRDLTSETVRDGRCVVLSGQLDDPYTGRQIAFKRGRQTSKEVEIDHTVALHYAWEHGADRWTDSRREEYANDPLVLIAVDGPANIRKSDHGPSEWEPPNRTVWCALAVRQAQVEVKYHITVTAIDKHTMIEVCS